MQKTAITPIYQSSDIIELWEHSFGESILEVLWEELINTTTKNNYAQNWWVSTSYLTWSKLDWEVFLNYDPSFLGDKFY